MLNLQSVTASSRKREAGCNKDNELIASDFRRFCRDRGIALDARNIEKLFSGFCAKVGQV